MLHASRLILASGSPRRRDLLRSAGFHFDICVPDVDESAREGETPEQLVERLARDKARAVAERASDPGTVLAADTIVVLDGEVLGKPADASSAVGMLRRLSGRVHVVLTGFALTSVPSSEIQAASERSRVRFREIPESEAVAYVATGEPMDKAGSYAVQGEGAKFIEAIEGLRSNVIGLPVERLIPLLARHGVHPQS